MRLLRIPLCVAVLLCSACQLDLQVDVDVDRNGGGVVAVAVAADEELLAMATDAQADPLGDLVAAGEALDSQGWRVAEATDDAGTRTVTLAAEFADAEAFDALMAQLASTLAADEVELLEPFTLTVTDDRVAVDGGASAQPRNAIADYGLSRGEAVRLLQRTDAFTYGVDITLPGEVLNSNATAAEGGRLQWDVAPGKRVAIAAESTRPGPPILRAVLGGLAGAVVAGVVLWLFARRRRA